MNSLDWIAKWADYTPNQTALISFDSKDEYTYKDLHIYALRLVEKFEELKLQEGDRVAVLAEHGLHYIVLMSACQRTGVVLVPLNYKSSIRELQISLDDCSPHLLIYSEHYKQDFEEFDIQNMMTLSLENLTYFYKQSVEVENRTFRIKEDAPLFIFYTSGTTSQPKGVLFTNKMMFWNSLNTSMLLGINHKDSTLVALPPYHTSGWHIFLTPLLHKGGKIIILQKFDPEKVLLLLDKHKITLFMALPTMLSRMKNTLVFDVVKLRYLKFIISGGETVGAALVNEYLEKKNISIRQGYGLTEAGPGITSLHHSMISTKPNSIGKPNFYLDIKILNNKGDETRAFEVGELCLKGDVVTPGYWNNSIETSRKIKNGWLHTGDYVYSDDEGYLFLQGRKDDMYISGGENIYPKEVELLLLDFDKIKKAVILAVKDEFWGEIGLAFVTVKKGTTVDEIRNYLKLNLISFKHPKHIFILKEIPETSLGKINRKNLIEYFETLKHNT